MTKTFRDRYQALAPTARQAVLVIGLVTLATTFSLAAAAINADVSFPAASITLIPLIPLIFSIIGVCMALRGREKAAGWLTILGLFVGLLLVPILSDTSEWSSIAAVVAFALPTFLAILILPHRQITWTIIPAALVSGVIILIDIYKPDFLGDRFLLPRQGILTIQITATVVILVFAFLTIRRFPKLPLRIKLILALGLMTVIPIFALTLLTGRMLETSLTSEAEQKILSFSDQSASAFDDFILDNLNSLRVESQIPNFLKYLNLPEAVRANSQEENLALSTLLSLDNKDSINITSYSVVDPQGAILLSSVTERIGTKVPVADVYQEPLRTGRAYAKLAQVEDGGSRSNSDSTFFFSAPIRIAGEDIFGVLVARYNGAILQQLIVQESSAFAPELDAILLNEDFTILAHRNQPDLLYQSIVDDSPEIVTKLSHIDQASVFQTGTRSGSVSAEIEHTEIVGAVSLQHAPWIMMVTEAEGVLLQPLRQQTEISVLVGILTSILAVFASLGAAQLLVIPIKKLTETTEIIAAGNLELRAEVQTDDELGTLASAFNGMTGQLQGLITSLEAHVADRTMKLSLANTNLKEEISERQRVEETLRRSEKHFRSLIENASDIITILEKDGTIRYESPSIKRVLGYTPEELIGQKAINLVHPDDASAVMEDIDRVVQTAGQSLFPEFRFQHKDGSWRTLEMIVQYLPEESEIEGVVINSRDITERKQADKTLKAYAAKLEKSNRELEEFAYIASHDLQEPLRKVTAFGSRLQAKYGEALGDRGLDYLDRMLNATDRMQTLINGLLSYSRVTSKAQPFAPVDLGQIAEEVISDLEMRIKEVNGRVEISDLPTVQADPLQMRQLFQNLIGNALKFNKPGEVPVVKVYGRHLNGQAKRPVGSDANSQLYEISVADNGIGFDEKYADRIFGVFQRLHGRSQYEGTGIGLAICKKIAERHGGDITAMSTPGEGANFVITLPVRQISGDSQQ